MMERETWLTAQQAKEKGLVDAVMFEEKKEDVPLVAGPLFELPDEEKLNRARRLLKEESNKTVPTDLLKVEWDFLMLKRR